VGGETEGVGGSKSLGQNGFDRSPQLHAAFRKIEKGDFMGRKPKPTQVKLLNGNPGKRPLNEREPEYPVGLLDAPRNLSDVGRKEWLRVGNLLCQQRVLTQADFAVLAVYCWNFQEWIRVTNAFKNGKARMIAATPNGYEAVSAFFVIEGRLEKQMMSAAVELGLTPSSRSRIKGPDKNDGGGQMMELLGGG